MKTRRCGHVDQAAELGKLTGLHHVFGEAMSFDGGQYGDAIFSRRPIELQPRAAAGLHTWQSARATVYFCRNDSACGRKKHPLHFDAPRSHGNIVRSSHAGRSHQRHLRPAKSLRFWPAT